MFIDQANVENRDNFKPVKAIYETSDYDSFKFLNFNREAKPRKDLLEALEENGRFYEPIIVNKDMEVLDGQHRLLSAKMKRAPITFYIVGDAEAKEVIKSVNTERKNWSRREYIDFYAALGDKNYKILKEYIESDLSDFAPDSVIIEVLAGVGTNVTKRLRNGTLRVGNLDKADDYFDFMRRVAEETKSRISTRAGRLLRALLPHKEIDRERLFRVISHVDVYDMVSSMDGQRAIEYVMSEYNKGLSTNYINHYFDSQGQFQVVKHG